MGSDSRVSLTVLGATGFTGKFVVKEVVQQLPLLLRDNSSFTWSIAGRNQAALEELVDSIRKDTTSSSNNVLPTVTLADVADTKSLKHMALQTHLVLTCVGPYAHLGEPVVDAVVTASEELHANGKAPTDYADLCGEPNFIERMVLKYSQRATDVGCTILHAAGFDSIPADIGLLESKRQLLEQHGSTTQTPSAFPTSTEMFFRLNADAKHKFAIHYATYAAAVNGFGTRGELSKTRKALYSQLPRVQPAALAKGLSSGFPSRPSYLNGAIQNAQDVGTGAYLIPFFFADPSIIRLSQALDAKLETGVPPIQLQAWIVVPSLTILLILTFYLTLFTFLARFELGRRLLLANPRLFSAGFVSHAGPNEDQLATTSFTTTFVTRAHSAALLAADSGAIGPDVRKTLRVSGPEIGYVTTPICYVAAARVLLSERVKVRKGVLTPALALSETNLVKDLNKDGRVKFTLVD